MCWMSIRREEDALARGIIETRRGEEISGGHSWGYAYVDDGEIVTEHGLGNIPEDLHIPVVDNALVHTRYATKGNITIENSHPFEIRGEDGEVVAAMGHNGTWYEAPDHKRFSDTWFMGRLLEHNVEKEDTFEEAVVETADECGETMVILHRSGRMYIYSGRFRITRTDSVVQSSGYEEIPTGEILVIDEDGDVDEIDSWIGDPKGTELTDFVDK